MEELANKTEVKKKITTSSSSSCRSTSRNKRRQIFGDLGFFLYGQIESSPWLLEGDHHHHETTFEYQKMKMPPLNGGMAMTQHLKSWPYALYCQIKLMQLTSIVICGGHWIISSLD